MMLLIAIAIGAIGIGIGTATQSAQGQFGAGGNTCTPSRFDRDDRGNGQSFHDCNGDAHANGQP